MVRPVVPLKLQLSTVTVFVVVLPVAFGPYDAVTSTVGVFVLSGKVIPPLPLTVIDI
jgi:hypothetical protein